MTQIDEPNLDELKQEILKQSYVGTTVVRWSKLPDEPIEQTSQAIIEIPIGTLMDIIEPFIATQVAEAEKQGALNALTQLKVDYMNEWVGIDPKTMGLKTAPLTYQALIEDRIAQLRSTPNEDMDN